MTKKIFTDIIPNDKRSIRNIPLINKSGEIDDHLVDPATAQEKADKSSKKTENLGQESREREMHEVIHHKQHTGTRATDGVVRKHEKSPAETTKPTESKDSVESTSSADIYDESIEEDFEEWREHHKAGPWKIVGAIGMLLVIGIFLLTFTFARATIRISPTKHEITLKETKIALDDVTHKIIETSASAEVEVKANGMAKVDRKATGKVVLYNAFNSSAQKLVEKTRLQTPNGLIYLTKTAVTIPGQKTVSGKLTPGSVEVEVEAEKAGTEYNKGFQDFTIVAYKGTDRGTKIYGRSKTALANGYSGTVPNIANADIASGTEKLKKDILAKIDAEFTDKAAKEDKNGTYSYLSGGKSVTYGEVKQTVSKDGTKATLSLKADALGIILIESEVAKLIVKSQSAEDDVLLATSTTDTAGNVTNTKSTVAVLDNASEGDEIVYEGDLSKLDIKLDPSTNIDNARVTMTLSGQASITSAIDTDRIARSVSGLSKEQALAALKKFIELDSVEISILPWWKSTLPHASNIKIEAEK